MSSWSISVSLPAPIPVRSLKELELEEMAECVLFGGELRTEVYEGAERGLLLITPKSGIIIC